MEALKIFNKDMDDGEPYKIFNRSGYPLELRDTKVKSSVRRLSENAAMEWQGWRDLYSDGGRRSQREGGQQMLLNLMVLKREYVDPYLEEIDDVEEESVQKNNISVDLDKPPSPRVPKGRQAGSFSDK